MAIDRRSFLKHAFAAPFLAQPTVALAQDRIPIGLQLYTVGAELEKDFEGALSAVARIGYREVELWFPGAFAVGFGRSPQQIRAALRNHGLTGSSAHVRWDSLGDRLPRTIEGAQTLGLQYVVVNSIDQALRAQHDIWNRAADELNRAGQVCRAAGLQLAYHNHLYEFTPLERTTKHPYDVLLELTDPSLVKLQMDICWLVTAGQDPATYLKSHPGRYLSVHVRDLKRLPRWTAPIKPTTVSSELYSDVVDVGQGVLDWPTILTQCWSGGIRQYYVETDRPAVPFDSINKSFVYLNRIRVNTRAR